MRSIDTIMSEGRERRAPRPLDCRIFTADGAEVFLTQVCTKCHRTKPLKAFGLRRMADGKVRSIPQCKVCRSNPSVPVRIETRS